MLDEADLLPLEIRSGYPTGDRVHLRLGRSSGWLVCFPAWVRSCSFPRFRSLPMTMLMALS